MVRMSIAALGAALLLAGCSTTVAGTPEADPSGMPRPDTGSYATAPRTVDPMTEKVQAAAEGFRMMEIIPLATQIDGSVRYAGRPGIGRISSSIGSAIGDGVATALEGLEVGAYTSAGDKAPGSTSTDSGKDLITGVFRFKDEAAARAAVGNPAVFADDKGFAGSTPTPKVPVTVPGYADAKAYTKTTTYSTSTVGLVASGRYVLAGWTTGPLDWVKKFFDLQIPALKDFTPTPVDKFSTLTRDHDDLLRYTLAESTPTIYQATLNARTMTAMQNDITAAVKDFADAGVDYVAQAGNNVYRARDAAGAALLADRFITETRTFYAGSTESKPQGVPGGRCLTYPSYSGSKDTRTYCVAPVGRYLAEVSDTQQTRANQAIGASYLILQGVK
ncbi:hypothetical protein [Tsukamurella sp. NPDC003166]|uniref:DUF7373 family lipoprotein n=1 Tax=Tsukamurella sp. NPDC003166 TaxID=3154444 RepID=UPI0033B2EB28